MNNTIMLHNSLKAELHTLIDNTDDEGLLLAIKAEILTWQGEDNPEFDDLSYLTPEERQELEELATEDPMKDTISFEEHKRNMEKWRSKL
jgi:hypothetical protein